MLVHCNSIWARFLNFWCWFSLVLSNSLCDCHFLNITEPHYNWLVNKLFTVTHLLRKQKLVITSLHILVEIHFYYDFLLFSSSPNCLENLMKKVLKKMVQCVILRHSVRATTIISPSFYSALSFFASASQIGRDVTSSAVPKF